MHAGRASIRIGPDGKVYPCAVYGVEAGDFRTHSIKEI